MHTKLTRADILSLEDYEKIRPQRQEALRHLKKNRRLFVGPYAVFLFENRETLWGQIHEMLRIEKGGEAQIDDELSAYGPLVPNGSELVATLMFEIEDPPTRGKILGQLGHVEHTIFLRFGEHHIQALPTEKEERTDEVGKTSAVHFLTFPFSLAQKQDFLEKDVFLDITHPAYLYATALPETLVCALSQDLFV